jgi:Putative peptidoglycan binding domain
VLRSESSKRLETTRGKLKATQERLLIKEASKRLVEVPAVFETLTERVKVADASTQWKRGRAWASQAKEARPVNGFNANTVSKDAMSTSAASADSNAQDDDVMCLVEVPERFETLTKRVLKTPATVREIEVRAQYAMVATQAIDVPASVREVDVPKTYQTVTSQVIDVDTLKAKGFKFADNGDIVATPAGERVLRASAVNGKSSKTAGAGSGVEGYVREVKEPAQYNTVKRQVIDQPATVRMVDVPVVTKIVSHRVVKTAPSSAEGVIPAVYKTVSRSVVDLPASTREVDVPAQYETLNQTVKVGEARTEWRSILCETNATPAKPKQIQQALMTAGYKPGPLDGVFRATTMKAVNDYQVANKLPVDAYLNLDTVKALGVAPN